MSQNWTADVSGTNYGNPELSKQELTLAYKQMRLVDAVTPAKEYALGKQSGDKVAWRILGRISGVATTALAEYQKVPFAKPPEYHASATVSRYATAIAVTQLRRDLDRIDVDEANIRVLRDHLARTHNRLIWTALKNGRSFSYVPTGSASSPTHAFAATSSMPANDAARNPLLFDFRKIARYFETYNVPTADGEGYFCFCSPIFKEGVLSDTGANGFVDVKKYASGGAEGILNGEIGTVHGFRLVMDNDAMNQSGVSEGIGSGSVFGTAFFLGADACKEVSVYPPHFRLKTDLSNDFNNQSGVAWQSLLTYAVEKSYASHGEGSILHFASQNL